MNDNPLDRIPDFGRVSIPAVVVEEGEDVGAVLSAAGIVDAIALPVVFGESPDVAGGLLGDGMTQNLVAILETEALETEGGDQSDAFALAPEPAGSWPAESEGDSQTAGAALPAAYGMQPLAPVRPRGR